MTSKYCIKFVQFLTSLLLLLTSLAWSQDNASSKLELPPEQQTQLDKARELSGQANQLRRQGRIREAATIAEQALEIREKVLGPEHPDTAISLNNLAGIYQAQANYAAAELLYERALKIKEKVFGPEHPGTAISLDNLASLYWSQAKYTEAERNCQRALKIREKVFGPDHCDTANSLNNLAALYQTQGNYAAAEPLYQRALKIKVEVLGSVDPDTAISFNNLAVIYVAQAKYAAAEPLYIRALKIREDALGLNHPDTALSLNTLAELYLAEGKYSSAEPLYQRALKINEKVYGTEHPHTALSLSNLVLLFFAQADYRAAEPLCKRALKIRETVLGPEHPETATSLVNLASIYQKQDNYAAAEPLYRRALKIREKALGPEHPDTALSLIDLASIYRSQAKWAEAETLYQRALEICEKALGTEHPHTALSLSNLAVLFDSQANYAAAEPLYRRALMIDEKALGPEHPDTASSLNNLARLFCAQGEFTRAMPLIDKERRGQRAHVSRVLPALSAQKQEMFLYENFMPSFYMALSLGARETSNFDATISSATWLLNGKGVAQEALAQRNLQTRDLNDPKLAPVVEELLDVRTRLASLAMNAAEPGKEKQRQVALDQLTAQEQELASQLRGNNKVTSEWIELSQIREALPTDGVLIDIARFDVFDFGAKGIESNWKPAHYVAWITSPEKESKTKLIDLGEADDIDQLVEKVRKQISADATKQGAIVKAGEDAAVASLMQDMSALADKIWKPLAPHVGVAKQIVLSPDGALWLAPWNALPVNDSRDEYLLERYNIRLVISGRDLIAKPDDRKTTAAVIVANPNFDQPESQKKSAIEEIFKSLPAESDDATRDFSAKSNLPKVQPLPNTGLEALAIQPHLETYTKQKASLYQQQYALERVAKSLRNPQIATFATHGFFLPTQETKHEDRTTGIGNETRSVAVDTTGNPIENPLLRCGLLFSGCNNRHASVADDDGILTGMEIVSIDLRGTELVVLSACETGIGDVKNGEGVAGLRQAFQLAGAEAVVSTLWQVPDRDSALLMTKFFTELAAGKTKAEALRAAQLERIEKRRERFGAAHPFYWAAFTLTGQ